MTEISSDLLFIAFILYLIATFFFGGAIRDKRGVSGQNRWSLIGIIITIIGFASQVGYCILRWIAAGHAPVSNMFEFTTFFGMMLVAAFIIIYFMYKVSVLGVFTLPIALLIIAYASMFAKDITPLIPALQSYWLQIHVTTAALGEAVLAISFGAGLIYLIKAVDQTKKSKRTFWLEFIMYSLISTLSFILVAGGFGAAHYSQSFSYVNKSNKVTTMNFTLPSIVAPHEGQLLKEVDGQLLKDANGEFVPDDSYHPLIKTPAIINANKLNTVIWSFASGFLLYWIIRLILRKRISASLKPLVKHINLNLVDEISYRSVAIGFPIFTLGGLIFAMIWAQLAWTRFWGWDPKEDWALITFLFYAAFLHLRLSKGWHGEKSAWLAVIGFAIIMFNLVAVNLVVAGLHSYAG